MNGCIWLHAETVQGLVVRVHGCPVRLKSLEGDNALLIYIKSRRSNDWTPRQCAIHRRAGHVLAYGFDPARRRSTCA